MATGSMWGDILSAALPALVEAGGTYVANRGNAAALDRQSQDKMNFEAGQADLQRQFELEKLAMQIAAQNGGGAGAAAQKAALQQRAYESAIDAMLTGAQNQHGAANTLLQGWTIPARS